MVMHTRSEDLRRTGRPDIVRRGEDNVAAKLTAAQVLEMRALAATGVYTKSKLAQRYPVTRTSVVYAVTGRTWGHLPGALSPAWRRYIPPQGRPQRRGLGFRQRQILLMAYDRTQGGSGVLLTRDIFKELYGWPITPSSWGAWFNPMEIGFAAYRMASGHVSRSITALRKRGLLTRGERRGHLMLTPEGIRRARRWRRNTPQHAEPRPPHPGRAPFFRRRGLTDPPTLRRLALGSPPAKLRARPRTGFGLLGFGNDIVVGFDDHGDGVPEHLGDRRKIAGMIVQIF